MKIKVELAIRLKDNYNKRECMKHSLEWDDAVTYMVQNGLFGEECEGYEIAEARVTNLIQEG